MMIKNKTTAVLVTSVLLIASADSYAGLCVTPTQLGGAGPACTAAVSSAGLGFLDRFNDVFSVSGSHVGVGGSTTVNVPNGNPGPSHASRDEYGSVAANSAVSGTALGGYGSASSSADFRTGVLNIFGTLMSTDNAPVANTFQATSDLRDTLSIFIPKSIVNPKFTISLDIKGTTTGSQRTAAGVAQAELHVSSLDGVYQYDPHGGFQVQFPGTYASSIVSTFDVANIGIDRGSYRELDIQYNSFLFALGNSNYDFNYSAQLNILATDGVTYTSGSGLLLAPDAPSAVPEPTSIALLGFGLACVAASRRKR